MSKRATFILGTDTGAEPGRGFVVFEQLKGLDMTEAMSRHEIEDVLSSIRRLVSHDDRAPSGSVAPVAANSGKLILTPAFRVDDGGAPIVPDAAPNPGAPDAPHDNDPANTAFETADQARAQGAPAMPTADRTATPAPLLTRIAQAAQRASTPDAPATSKTEEAPTKPSSTESVNNDALEATLARLEEALSITPPGSDKVEGAAVDEQVMTQIVSRIVRQELQGELGVRITRNIRKLVRAEVARELQMRNL